MTTTALDTTKGARSDTGAPRPDTRRKSRLGVPAWIAWLFVAPFIVTFVTFTVIPAIAALSMSFTDIGIRDLRNPLGVNFVGLETFAQVFSNPEFLRAVGNTLLFVLCTLPATLILGFVLALILDTGIRRLRGLFRTAIYVPVVVNIVAAAVIWQYAFNVDGPFNEFLDGFGIDGPNWLGDPALALPTVAVLGVWRNLGAAMILFLAGLQARPTEVDEAAAVDGAGYLRRLFSITLPLLRPTTLLVSVILMERFINIFDEPFLVTRGGPIGSTETLAIWVFERFGFGEIAQAMAGSLMMLVLVGVVALIQFRFLRPKE